MATKVYLMVRLEKKTAEALWDIKIVGRETYNEVVIRLLESFNKK